ncbi:DUF1361 domain-containing protein [Candidatus Gottesmanbacteria bacterium]|nr:DUF1361 domain-containing protein [Candidatus Gottesmanbacteria bacterium]
MIHIRKRFDVISLLPLVWGTVISFGLLGIRFVVTSDDFYLFLPWNLLLAIVPFVISYGILLYYSRKEKSFVLLLGLGLVWLIFFPNAPYITTDFIHLAPRTGVPVWFDALLILAFASTGLLSGYYSLSIMQLVVRSEYSVASGWIFVFGSLVLASFGIYLGRFLRWNSWDLFLDPIRLTHDVVSRIFAPTVHTRFWVVSGLLLLFLIGSYMFLYWFLQGTSSLKRKK